MANGDSKLDSFLKHVDNRVDREVIFNHRLSYDLKVAAACHGYHLQIFRPDVDRDGYDLVLEDGDESRKVQVKSIYDATTKAWAITKRLLRPSLRWIDPLGFEASPFGEGQLGGVITVWPVISSSGALEDVYYKYTDVLILTALALGLMPGKQPHQQMIGRVHQELRKGTGRFKLRLPAGCFIRPKDHDSLLTLMGLHSRCQSNWRSNVLNYSAAYGYGIKMAGAELPPKEYYANYIQEEIGKLSSSDAIPPSNVSAPE